MNLAPSLAESYIYMDMFNRGGGNGEYEVDANAPERIMGGGAPVDYILPSISSQYYSSEGGHRTDEDEDEDEDETDVKKSKGPFADKVVPVGLVIIQSRRDSDVEYDDHFHPGMNREVVSDSLYEILIGSVMVSANKGKSPKKRRPVTKKNRNQIRKNTK